MKNEKNTISISIATTIIMVQKYTYGLSWSIKEEMAVSFSEPFFVQIRMENSMMMIANQSYDILANFSMGVRELSKHKTTNELLSLAKTSTAPLSPLDGRI